MRRDTYPPSSCINLKKKNLSKYEKFKNLLSCITVLNQSDRIPNSMDIKEFDLIFLLLLSFHITRPSSHNVPPNAVFRFETRRQREEVLLVQPLEVHFTCCSTNCSRYCSECTGTLTDKSQ